MTVSKKDPNDPPWLKRYKKLWDKQHAPTIWAIVNGAETLISRAEWAQLMGGGMSVTGSLAKALDPAPRAPADPSAQPLPPPGPSPSPEDP